jgi:hypothetical protein
VPLVVGGKIQQIFGRHEHGAGSHDSPRRETSRIIIQSRQTFAAINTPCKKAECPERTPGILQLLTS